MQKTEPTEKKFHSFVHIRNTIALPEKFTYPFHYTPHPLCVEAAKEVQAYLALQQQWQAELQQGKMFGVLIVQNETGAIGFLAAFSGMLDGKNRHSYFVPPIYDLQQADGFFKPEEEYISALNVRIHNLENDILYMQCQEALKREQQLAVEILAKARIALTQAREERAQLRQHHLSVEEQAKLQKESQYQKAEFKRLKQRLTQQSDKLQTQINAFEIQIQQLKTERKKRSAALQQQLFKQFNLINALGKTQNLCKLFQEAGRETPPAGAGECAAPRLLQYAYQHQLKPLAMAEFWWGNSPKSEIRRHGFYYPACKEKCEPILKHMLQGLKVENNPLDKQFAYKAEILYEDEWIIVVNKPAGMLSVPGKSDQPSVYRQFKLLYPEASGPLLVHRLDMATSGLLLIAKNKKIHQQLQAQFCKRSIKKRYTALLDGVLPATSGLIDLPLCPDPYDRPRQIVNYEYGKPAITQYQVIERRGTQTLVAFYPLTGRTHQLRVHAAHPQGLNAPIIGDTLYGQAAERLYLHAEQLEFRHPVSGAIMTFEKKAIF